MVGVAGRSKGCNTCRKRRVKCDEAKPQCYRCIKAGFECLGYERATQWRHSSIVPRPVSRQCVPELTESKRPVALGFAPPEELSLVAFESDVCTTYLFSNFVWKSYGSLWLDQAAQGKLGALSLDAVKALAQLSFGLSNRVKDLQLKGVAQYGRCLRILAEELGKDGAAAHGNERLMVPILVLMMVSAIQQDRTAATFHLKAIRKVLMLCGPEAFQRQPLRNAFEAARATLLTASLFSRRRTFLDDPHWQDVPWVLDRPTKTPQSQLLDILVAIPGLLEDDSHIENMSPHPNDEFIDPCLLSDEQSICRLELSSRIADQLKKLYRWRWDWQFDYGQYVTLDDLEWQSSSPAPAVLKAIANHGEPGRLKFRRAIYADDIMLYNATLMWLLALLWKLEPSRAASVIDECAHHAAASPMPLSARSSPTRSPHCTSFEPLRPPGACFSIREPAMEVCHVFDWQCRHHEQYTNFGDQTCLYLFPLGMARSVLDADLDILEWIDDMLDSNPVTTGYGRGGGSVVGFGSYITKQALGPDIKYEDVF